MVSHVLIPIVELLVQFDLFALVPIRPPKQVTESHEALFAGEHTRASPPGLKETETTEEKALDQLASLAHCIQRTFLSQVNHFKTAEKTGYSRKDRISLILQYISSCIQGQSQCHLSFYQYTYLYVVQILQTLTENIPIIKNKLILNAK